MSPKDNSLPFTRRSLIKSLGVALALGSFSISASADTFKVAIVLPGVITDKSFNQAGYEGVVRAEKELGIEMAYSEKVPQPDQPQALADYARRGYDLVIGHGGEFQESVGRIARRHPDTMFLVVNGSEPKKNMAVMQFDMKSMGYVMGYTAGKISSTGKGGYIGAQKVQSYTELGDGFSIGFKAARPDGEALSAWTNDWDDIAKGKEAALNLISQGVDTIFPTMDNAVIGSLRAVKEKKAKGFGIYYDAIVDWPDTVMQSAILDMRGALLTTIKTAKEGKLSGQVYRYGFETPQAFRIGSFHPSVPAEIQAEVTSIVQQIEIGQLNP
ncbi:BMP family protein [Amphritea sp. HPY]|uniref:BMP family protein n=1 Tax=Amphritea sp. HPY TaxID=3421652 RepID=UPI003D7CC50A